MLLIRHKAKTSLNPWSLVSTSLGSAFQTVSGLLANSLNVATRRFRLGHDIVLERFVDSILLDMKPPVTGEEGREVVRVMEMIVEKLHHKYGSPQLRK